MNKIIAVIGGIITIVVFIWWIRLIFKNPRSMILPGWMRPVIPNKWIIPEDHTVKSIENNLRLMSLSTRKIEYAIAINLATSKSSVMQQMEALSMMSETQQNASYGRVWTYTKSLHTVAELLQMGKYGSIYVEFDRRNALASSNALNELLKRLPPEKIPTILKSPFKTV